MNLFFILLLSSNRGSRIISRLLMLPPIPAAPDRFFLGLARPRDRIGFCSRLGHTRTSQPSEKLESCKRVECVCLNFAYYSAAGQRSQAEDKRGLEERRGGVAMSTILSRSVLAPLKLCPESASKIQVLLSPSLSKSSNSTSNGHAHVDGHSQRTTAPSAPFLPTSCLPELIEQCPSLWGRTASYLPSPHLPSGHMQTIYSAGANTVMQDQVHYKRRVIMVPDGGIISLDIAERKEDEGKDHPTVVILHGLTGGSQES